MPNLRLINPNYSKPGIAGLFTVGNFSIFFLFIIDTVGKCYPEFALKLSGHFVDTLTKKGDINFLISPVSALQLIEFKDFLLDLSAGLEPAIQ
ncbi:hypothetical protein [Microbulbifer spongiae]|uniref:Uncharacterized protein n=1 Tax=Microbulbifer spongiae TaxID=2944933 RepID=A0ABY9E7X5_9GAMM|nr:hypothetical protein [Microbulbifer sp. MI-G]WKD48452.1 hypothetical protein M8T91_10990 [Microbulbifer sp. MI-G]